MTNLWKVACQENVYPGMWQRWYKNQCVAVGWAAKWGFNLVGGKREKGWAAARNALGEMQPGDFVVVALKGNRIGRIGQITSKEIGDDQWAPLVPPGVGLPDGEMGRRVLVRWDLTVGPDNPDLVVQLPPGCRLTSGELRPTVSRIRSIELEELIEEMNKPSNWVSLLGNFSYEKALSDFIANYPSRLEDGLLPHPNSRIREKVFVDRTRLDVLLIDRHDRAVIVECKQHAPTASDFEQLRRYMALLTKEVGAKQAPRGILVHGGALALTQELEALARKSPPVDVVCYSLDVIFRRSIGT